MDGLRFAQGGKKAVTPVVGGLTAYVLEEGLPATLSLGSGHGQGAVDGGSRLLKVVRVDHESVVHGLRCTAKAREDQDSRDRKSGRLRTPWRPGSYRPGEGLRGRRRPLGIAGPGPAANRGGAECGWAANGPLRTYRLSCRRVSRGVRVPGHIRECLLCWGPRSGRE